MDNLLEKYRTPIASFCIGVLFASIVSWAYLEKKLSVPSDQQIEIVHARVDSDDSVQKSAYISGAVDNPGSYKVDSDLYDYIQESVGFANDADLEQFRQVIGECGFDSCIIVPTRCESAFDSTAGTVSGAIDVSEGLVSLNNATQQELESLPGIGPVYAERIIDRRPYSSISEITSVKGIGEKTLQKIKPLVSL